MSLSTILDPTDAQLWAATVKVTACLRAHDELEPALDRALDAIVEEIGADRGFLLLPLGDGDTVWRARGREGPLASTEHEEISRRIVRQVRQSQARVYWDGVDARGEGSLGELGIVAALATPIWTGDPRTMGVLYLDLREPGKSFGPAHERFVEVAASLLAPMLRGAMEIERRDRQLDRQRAVVGPDVPLWDLVGTPSMERLANELRLVLRSSLNVLVLGESGTGKTSFASALGRASRSGPVVRATLGSSDDLNTITSELFGHVRGAFSGASRRRVGLVEHADGGTLVLDEVLNLPMHAQQLLLDLTQFGTFRPLGDDAPNPRQVSIRLIAVTNGDLEAAMEAGRFRRDLYHRLAGHVLVVPPLRERRRDVPAIAENVLCRIDPSRLWHVSLGARRLLSRSNRPWDGNVRELESVLARARSRALLDDDDADVLELVHFAGELGELSVERPTSQLPPGPLEVAERWAELERSRDRLAEQERAVLVAALELEDGVVSRVARRLQVPRTTLLHRLRLHDLSAGR